MIGQTFSSPPSDAKSAADRTIGPVRPLRRFSRNHASWSNIFVKNFRKFVIFTSFDKNLTKIWEKFKKHADRCFYRARFDFDRIYYWRFLDDVLYKIRSLYENAIHIILELNNIEISDHYWRNSLLNQTCSSEITTLSLLIKPIEQLGLLFISN